MDHVSQKKLTVPNAVTVIRMVMAAVAAIWFAAGHAPRAAFLLCAIATALDAFDGWYARRFSQVTHLGEHLDPFADKLLVGVILSVFAARTHSVAVWVLVGLIALREVGMTAFRSYSLQRHQRFIPANALGKFKMIIQSVFGLFVLGLMVLPSNPPALSLPISVGAVGLIVLVSWVSAGVYLRDWRAAGRIVAEEDEAASARRIAAG